MSREISAWNQGDVIVCRECPAFASLLSLDTEPDALIIASHDCDIASDEQIVEVLPATFVDVEDGLVICARHPRKLHIDFLRDGHPQWAHVEQHPKHSVNKNALKDVARGEGVYPLHSEQKKTLQHWLASRYERSAFPESFANRLATKVPGGAITERIGKIAKKLPGEIHALFLDLGEYRFSELKPEETYMINIYVVYDSQSDPSRGRFEAEQAVEKLKKAFEDVNSKKDIGVFLEKCHPASDREFTLAHALRMDRWRLEYISLRDGESHIGATDV